MLWLDLYLLILIVKYIFWDFFAAWHLILVTEVNLKGIFYSWTVYSDETKFLTSLLASDAKFDRILVEEKTNLKTLLNWENRHHWTPMTVPSPDHDFNLHNAIFSLLFSRRWTVSDLITKRAIFQKEISVQHYWNIIMKHKILHMVHICTSTCI